MRVNFFGRLFARDFDRYEGVRRINIYLLRLLFGLMFFVLGADVWGYILRHQGPWSPMEAVAYCVWAGFSALSILGLLRPLRMLPILLLEVFYKLLWLALVASPIWSSGASADPQTASIIEGFVWVLLPIVAIPWGYAFRTFVLGAKRSR